MSALTALISDAHRLRATPVSINPYAYCTCGQWDAADWDEAQEFLEHLIEVTEAAVREQIAADIEGIEDPPLDDRGHAYIDGYDHGVTQAARIAQGQK